MKVRIFLMLLLCCPIIIFAQLSIQELSTTTVIDFDQTIAGVGTGSFMGNGFTTNPSSGELNANAWATTGWSDGSKPIGVSNFTGDHARGMNDGAVATGGIYGFEIGESNMALGVQPTAGDCTPGTLSLQIDNNSGSIINALDINYIIYVMNDQNYASSFNFSISYDNLSFYDVSSGNFTSPETASGTNWEPNIIQISLSSLYISPGSSFYLRWSSSDVSGSGSRDELALDDISITAQGITVNCEEPTSQASSLSFGTVTSNSIQASFSSNGADKYLIIQSSSPNLSAAPIDGMIYNEGTPFGNGEVIQYSNSSSFNSTGLEANTMYYYFIFATNDNCNGGPDYLNLNPLTDFTNTVESLFSDYYASIGSETCEELKTALFNLIDGHTSVSYSSLWTHYQSTDDHLNDSGNETIVWDMYSDNPDGAESEFTFVTEQCGNYQSEGDCYNREHTFPKSWWGGSTSEPQYTDIFAVIPTDGWINGLRSNNPYGEVQSGTETHVTNNGSKMGASSVTIPGYTGSVFEPTDDYKGDLARGYFYMATRYEDVIASWENSTTESDAVLDGTSYTVFEPWMLDMLINWHNNDPVDQKELDRNEAIFAIQGNRNPFIDHPEYVADIWSGCIIDSCIYVYTIADNGPGSLRAAIECSSTNDIITFSPDVFDSNIFISSDSLVIDKNITIEALPEQNIKISASLPYVSSLATIFKISNGSQVTFRGFTIDGAFGPHGSAISNEGVLSLENMTITSGGNTQINSVILNKQAGTINYTGTVLIE